MASYEQRHFHGVYGLGPTGHFPEEMVELEKEDGSAVSAPWRMLRYSAADVSWWEISPTNGEYVFLADEAGVFNVLKYAYDVVYLRAAKVNWPWKLTLEKVARASAIYGNLRDGKVLLERATNAPMPPKASELTREVVGLFLELLRDALPENVPCSPPVQAVDAPSSPFQSISSNEYDPDEGLYFSDDELEEGEIRD